MTADFNVAPYLLGFARSTAWVYSAPLLSSTNIPPKVRVGFAALLALVLGPLRQSAEMRDLVSMLPGEIMLGLIFGFSARLFLAGLEAAGQLIGMMLGIGFSGFFDAASGEESLPTRRLCQTLGALAFLSLDGIELSIAALSVAPHHDGTFRGACLALARDGSTVFVQSVRAAAPILVAAMVTNVAAAFAARATPSLNVFSVVLALFLAVGVFALVVTAPAFVRECVHAASRAIEAPSRILLGS